MLSVTTMTTKSTNNGSTADTNNYNVYETDTSLNQYLSLHYPSSGRAEGVASILPHDGAPTHGLGFPQRVAQLLIRLSITPAAAETAGREANQSSDRVDDVTATKTKRALDVGCAVGGSAFELAKAFERVDAFDYSANFIRTANRMKGMDRVTFRVPMEGDIFQEIVAVHEEGVTPDVAARVNFFVGDACQMDDMMVMNGVDEDHDKLLADHAYDGIIMSNLLCRLPDPMACLGTLPHLVKAGSVVVILTPFTWLEDYTPREKWLGGYYKTTSAGSDGCGDAQQLGHAIFSKDRLRQEMERMGFVMIHEEQMPLVIREHQRKYQYCISEATGWRKISL
jgi:putative 4-mercaptohistidine N1-methyltranferase